MVKLRIAGGDVRAQRMRAVFGQQALAFTLDAKVGAKVTPAVHDVLGGVVQIRRAGVLERRVAPARPRQTKVIARGVVAGFLVLAAPGLERLDVEHMHVAHVRLQPFRALAGVADGPAVAVDFAKDVLRHGLVHALDLLHLVVLRQFFAKAQAVSELLHDHVIAAAFPQWLDHFFTPLQRAVRCGHGATGFKLRSRRQQVHRTIRIQVFGLAWHRGHGSGGRRIRIHHHQQVELVHRPLHLQTTGLRVRCVAPVKDAAQVGVLVDKLVFFQHTVNPARHGDARLAHHGGRGIAALDPVKVNAPALGKMLPRAFGQAVVAR